MRCDDCAETVCDICLAGIVEERHRSSAVGEEENGCFDGHGQVG